MLALSPKTPPPGGGGHLWGQGEENEFPDTMANNNAYDNDRWNIFSDQLVPMLDNLKVVKAARLYLPLPPHNLCKEARPSFYIKDLCTSRCCQVRDHQPYLAVVDRVLLYWE